MGLLHTKAPDMHRETAGALVVAAAALLLAAAALLVAGCGSGDGGGETTTATSPAPAETSGGIDTLEGASTAPVTWAGASTQTALLSDVRAARHEGYDRVVFEFRQEVPGYDIRYVEPPVQADGSGAEVAVAGNAILRVRMEPALDADLTQEDAPLSYTGPMRFSPGTPEVVELVRTGGYESVLTWVIGLNDRADFRVLRLQDPPRLVIDLRNH